MSPLFGRKVIRLSFRETPQGMRVAGEEFLAMSDDPEGVRVRDVKQGPDGALYVVSDVRPNPAGGTGSSGWCRRRSDGLRASGPQRRRRIHAPRRPDGHVQAEHGRRGQQ